MAASRLGWKNVFQCEINPFCQKILKYHFPDTKLYEDIKGTDFTEYAGTIDVISGGFPCQPFSVAGKRKGTNDDRYLWPEMLRVIREVQPKWIVAENVSGITSQENGLVFERVCTDLESEGYEVQPFIIPACSVNAPHRRERIWIIANYNSIAAHSTSKRYVWSMSQIAEMPSEPFRNFPTQSPVCSGDDVFSYKLDGITFSSWRRKSIEAYGNAIVPQVAYRIFKAIEKTVNYENRTN